MSAFLDAVQARMEAVGAGAEVSGSELGALTDDLDTLLTFARAVKAAEKKWRQVGDQNDITFRSAVIAARRALEAS